MSLECRCIVSGAVLVLACIMETVAPGNAQNTAPTIEKWRPADGLYAEPGADFKSRCGEYGDLIIELAKKSVSGHEWGCHVTKLKDDAPDTIRLNLICNDYITT
jgi:hypothetical protein